MKNKQNIAMRCNQKQFEEIKPKLEKSGIEIKYISDRFEVYCFLVNNLAGRNIVSNVGENSAVDHGRIVHKQWNEKVFLEACGIETTPTLDEVKEYFKDADKIIDEMSILPAFVINWDTVYLSEFGNWCSDNRTHKYLWSKYSGYAKIITKKSPEYTITKDQILLLNKDAENDTPHLVSADLKKWFPQAFEEEKVELVVGKWYKNEQGAKFKITSFSKSGKPLGYGFTWSGVYVGLDYNESEAWSIRGSVEMTPQEVTEALKNEAVRRGFKEGVWVKTVHGNVKIISGNIEFRLYYNKLLSINDPDGMHALLFENGTWATIIPKKTKEEAEKLLNCKIV